MRGVADLLKKDKKEKKQDEQQPVQSRKSQEKIVPPMSDLKLDEITAPFLPLNLASYIFRDAVLVGSIVNTALTNRAINEEGSKALIEYLRNTTNLSAGHQKQLFIALGYGHHKLIQMNLLLLNTHDLEYIRHFFKLKHWYWMVYEPNIFLVDLYKKYPFAQRFIDNHPELTRNRNDGLKEIEKNLNKPNDTKVKENPINNYPVRKSRILLVGDWVYGISMFASKYSEYGFEHATMKVLYTTDEKGVYNLPDMRWEHADVIVLAFDLMNETSFDHLYDSVNQIPNFEEPSDIILVGINQTQAKEHKVSKDKVEFFAKYCTKGVYYECNPAENANTEQLFKTAIEQADKIRLRQLADLVNHEFLICKQLDQVEQLIRKLNNLGDSEYSVDFHSETIALYALGTLKKQLKVMPKNEKRLFLENARRSPAFNPPPTADKYKPMSYTNLYSHESSTTTALKQIDQWLKELPCESDEIKERSELEPPTSPPSLVKL